MTNIRIAMETLGNILALTGIWFLSRMLYVLTDVPFGAWLIVFFFLYLIGTGARIAHALEKETGFDNVEDEV